MDADVIVIGAGLSGLACALSLRERGLEPLLLDAADVVGGRVRTDRVDGFLLDRGFQVLQTWYPEARRLLDYDALDLRPFEPGALIRFGGDFHRVSDVWRRPSRLVEMIRSPVACAGAPCAAAWTSFTGARRPTPCGCYGTWGFRRAASTASSSRSSPGSSSSLTSPCPAVPSNSSSVLLPSAIPPCPLGEWGQSRRNSPPGCRSSR